MTKNLKELSACHKAPVTVGGDDTEGTHYYVCTKCHNICDRLADKDSTKLRELFKKHAHYEHSGGNTHCTSFDQQELEELLKDVQAHAAAQVAAAEQKAYNKAVQDAIVVARSKLILSAKEVCSAIEGLTTGQKEKTE